jgi:uncharacterized protein YneF (UPF0154 family)
VEHRVIEGPPNRTRTTQQRADSSTSGLIPDPSLAITGTKAGEPIGGINHKGERMASIASPRVANPPMAANPPTVTSAPIMRWGAIFGGVAAAIATWLMLYVLGLAVKFSSINQADAGTLKSLGLFSGLWSVIAPLPALFVGGLVVSRGAATTTKSTATLHAVVVWALGTLATAFVILNLLLGLVGGAFSAAKSTAQTAAGGVAAAAQGAAGGGADLAKNFHLDADAILRPINQRLQAAGQPPINTDQLQAAAKDAVQKAVQQGQVDRQSVVRSLVDNHVASPQDADQIAAGVESQYNGAKDKAQQAVQQAQQAGGKAANITGKTFWGIFAVLFLGLAATIGGALAGAARRSTPRPA